MNSEFNTVITVFELWTIVILIIAQVHEYEVDDELCYMNNIKEF